MKNIKTILMTFSLVLVYSFISAQGNCIKIFKGSYGCGCHCQKDCVTAAELPTYLANGWNTNGCINCCKWKNWVDAGDKNYNPGSDVASNPLSAFDITASCSQSNQKITAMDDTELPGRYVESPEFRTKSVPAF